ncbi:MAG: hypothetical protein HWE26_10965 [Alteromonadaceae bacterium]|nr:hypothetical protein [Alteromonadaceae bacterium]
MSTMQMDAQPSAELMERIRRENTPPLKRRMMRRVRSAVSTIPALYIPLRRRRRPESVIVPETEFLLEGYPRCGNTWALMALRHAATRPVEMAHHSHAAAHVIYGLQRSIPTLVLYRAPDAAVRSLLAMNARNMTALDAYREYVLFYETVLKQPLDKLAFASFEDVTQRIERVVIFLRDRFGLPLAPFDAEDPEEKAAVFALMDARAVELRGSDAVSRSNPNHYDVEQIALKRHADEQIAALADHPLRKRAQEIFADLTSDIT